MTGLGMDVRIALRAMVRRPLFTFTCVLTLALGFGSTIAVFTIVDTVILRSLSYPESHRLVWLFASEDEEENSRDNVSGADFLDWKEQSASFDFMAGFTSKNVNLTGTEFPVRVRGASVTPEFFSVLGVEPALGRTLTPTVDLPEAEPAVVVSDGFWRTHLEADPAAIGSVLRIDGRSFIVVGVTPPGFGFPADASFWASSPYRVPEPPFSLNEDPAENRGAHYFHVVGRLKPTVDLAAAQAEMTAIAARLAEEYPDTNDGQRTVVQSLMDSVVGDARPRLLLLLAMTGLVLLVACTNVAGMLLARATERCGEIGLRLAVGARRRRIVRQFLTESLVLAFAGGTIGVGLASWGTKALLAMAPSALPRANEVSVDFRVLAFAFLAIIGTSLIFGLAPAFQALRSNKGPVVNGANGRSVANEGRRLRDFLVVAEVAASLVLVIFTGLVIRTFANLNAVDPGFDPSGLVAAHVCLPSSIYQDNHAIRNFQRQTLEKLRSLPGVESATTVLTLPMHWNILGALSFQIEGRPDQDTFPSEAGYQVVDNEYFSTMRIPLLRGRLFDDGDVDGSPLVALINRTAAEQNWQGEDPIGKRVSWGITEGGDRIWVTIVGIVEDTYVEGLDKPPRPESYRPFAQDPFEYLTFVLRTTKDPASFSSSLRQAVLDVDPDQPVSGIRTMEEILSTNLSHRRFNMMLMTLFSAVAMVLAAVGLYGVLSFSISRRRREIGIRRALGALPRDIKVQFVFEGVQMIAFGLCIGTAAALLLARFLSTQLHGVSTTDPPTYVVAAILLMSVGLLASFLPARRASRVEPMTVLRAE